MNKGKCIARLRANWSLRNSENGVLKYSGEDCINYGACSFLEMQIFRYGALVFNSGHTLIWKKKETFLWERLVCSMFPDKKATKF